MAGEAFRTALACLDADGPPRVWSLIVTAFGDLAQGEDARLSGTLLTRLLGFYDVKPEAIRVALHRLRRDGWIDAERSGREGQYALSATGRAQSRAASPAIYGAPSPAPRDWHVLLAGSGADEGRRALDTALLEDGVIPVGPAAALVPGPVPQDPGHLAAFAIAPRAVPGWFSGALCPPDLTAAAARLASEGARLAESLDRDGALTPLEIAALRVLLVHGWRRVALRIPDVPDAFLPAGWQGAAARARVHEVLGRLPRPPLPEIEEAARRS